jgi:type I restriction enzyme S subunit
MGEWTNATVRDVVSHIASGPSPTCEERHVSGSEWGLLKTTAATWSGWNQNAHKVPPPEYWGQTRLEVQRDDVIITKAGPRNRVGVVVHVPQTRPRLMVSGKMVLLRPDRSRVVPRLLADVLASSPSQKYLDDRTTGMAEAQTNFANSALLNTPLRLPPLEEQRRIAEILDTIDESTQAAERVIAKLRSGLDALIDELAGSRLRVGTPTRPLGEMLQMRIDYRGRTPKKLGMDWGDGQIPALSANNVQMGSIDFGRECYLGSEALYERWMTNGRTAKGDLVITLEAPLGNVARIPDDSRYILSQRVVLLRFDPRMMLNDFAFWLLRSKALQSEMRRRSTDNGDWNPAC